MKTIIIMILLPVLSFTVSYLVCTADPSGIQIHEPLKDCEGGSTRALDGWGCTDWKPIGPPRNVRYFGMRPG